MFASAKENNVVNKSIATFKNNTASVLLMIPCMLLLGYGLFLNFSAIGQMVQFGTGISPIAAIIVFLVFTQMIKYSDIDGDGIGKYVSQALYLVMSAISLYWVFAYSNWTSDMKAMLATFNIAIYSTIIANFLVYKKWI